MKIKLYNWLIALAAMSSLLYILTFRQGINAALFTGKILGSLLVISIILALAIMIANVTKKDLSSKIQTRIFYFSLFFVLFSLVSSQSRLNSNHRKKRFIENCIEQLEQRKDIQPGLDNYQLRKYCECAEEKAKQINLSDTSKYNNPNSVEALELYGPCWEEARIKKVYTGIKKGDEADTVTVLNFASSIRIKVSINKEELFMIFDTGASDVLVSTDVINSLSDSSGVHYLDEYYTYALADGSEIEVQMALVDEFQIGKFHLENFKIAISDDVPTPLLGKSVLDLFSAWTINAKNQLILNP